MTNNSDFSSFAPRTQLEVNGKQYTIFSVNALEDLGVGPINRFPFSIRILLENLIRHHAKGMATLEDIKALASWAPDRQPTAAVPFMPTRVVLQDFTGVPALVDLAALRSALARHGGDPTTMNPFIPADLVIDHSIQVDRFGSPDAFAYNVDKEMERNRERYTMLHWGQNGLDNFRVVPPGTGIVHQVNLEYLASVVHTAENEDQLLAYPDSVLGTDSHTTMINGLGVMGWGVGGIEAEAVLLGQPYSLQIPEVIGMRLVGTMQVGTTATDMVLTITKFLREQGVVGRFVEFFGPGLSELSLPDRATIANMAPEYGATMGFFPVDAETIRYLQTSGRDKQRTHLVETYCRNQGFYFSPGDPEPQYSRTYEINLDLVVPSIAGPRKPQELLSLAAVPDDFTEQFSSELKEKTVSVEEGNMNGCPEYRTTPINKPGQQEDCDLLCNGAIVIAAITSCTNTSNPDVMIGAGLLARKAAALGLQTKPWVKTSMAPGSRVVTRYLEATDLLQDLEGLGFHLVGYGCTTCIGNSGPLDQNIEAAIRDKKLVTAAVLSGNRNFEARIHPQVQANYLCSPLLVVAYALAGTVLIDLQHDPLGNDASGKPIYLNDIWPSREEIRTMVENNLTPDLFTRSYSSLFVGNKQWDALQGENSDLFPWDPDSTYIREPPFFQSMSRHPEPGSEITKARVLAIFGDTITTDHISPAGAIAAESPAGLYLQQLGISPQDFNSYGSRRGNHEVMMRGTFANIRIRNTMVDKIGGHTLLMPEKSAATIYDAAMHYQDAGTPLVVFAGKDYGTGSSRDWAAKGTMLLGVRAVIAASFERIHRSNLVGMGVLPLQFTAGINAETLALDGSEQVTLLGLQKHIAPGQEVTMRIDRADSTATEFTAILRLDNAMEVEYYRHGGILHKVLRDVLNTK